MKIMRQLYNDFLKIIRTNKGYKIRETQVWYRLNSFEDYWVIGVDNLDRLPRVGETVNVSFLRNYIERSPTCVVIDVCHELENGTHIIDIHMEDRLQGGDKFGM